MESSNNILVIGGTGLVGRVVAQQLQRDGNSVRLLTRSAAAARAQFDSRFTLVEGSLEDDAALSRALEGCSGVHLSLPSGHDATTLERIQHGVAARVSKLALERGVRHLSYVSGYLVRDEFAHIPAEQAKLRAEAAIRSSGIPHTIFRPTYFTDTLPRYVQGQRASIFGNQPHPIRFLALRDFAQMISRAHSQTATDKAYFVCGPEALTFEAALRTYLSATGSNASISHAPLWMMKLMNNMFLKGALTEILQLMEATERVGEIGDPSEAIRLFGAAQTTVRAWAASQKA